MKRKPHILTLFDLDGTLAEHSEPLIRPVIFNYIEAVVTETHPMSHEAFMELMNQHNARGLGLFGWAAYLGKGKEWVYEHMRLISPLFVEAVRAGHQPNPEVHALLARLKFELGHDIVIGTHGHKEYAVPTVEILGLGKYFGPEDIYDITTANHALKTSASFYMHIVKDRQQRHRTILNRRNMVEDNADNLRAAKATLFHTVYLHTGDYPPGKGQLIDYQAQGLIPALTYLATHRS